VSVGAGLAPARLDRVLRKKELTWMDRMHRIESNSGFEISDLKSETFNPVHPVYPC
jgi:hypothetical protein